MEPDVARTAWHRLEAVHAVTYFSDEARRAASDLGLRGFWMGYFAGRAAPMGRVAPGVVDAVFFNFHPAKVRRALPDAWSFAAPEAILDARSAAAGAAIRRSVPDADERSDAVLPLLQRMIDRGSAAGRPLFAANRDLGSAATGAAALWQAATTLREHRGDGHVVALTAAGVDGCEAHVLFTATEGVDPAVHRDNRGWSMADWDAATHRLADRGLVRPDGTPTDAGRSLRRHVERQTDQLALVPYEALTGPELEHLLAVLAGIGAPILSSGEIPFPNPIGLPHSDDGTASRT